MNLLVILMMVYNPKVMHYLIAGAPVNRVYCSRSNKNAQLMFWVQYSFDSLNVDIVTGCTAFPDTYVATGYHIWLLCIIKNSHVYNLCNEFLQISSYFTTQYFQTTLQYKSLCLYVICLCMYMYSHQEKQGAAIHRKDHVEDSTYHHLGRSQGIYSKIISKTADCNLCLVPFTLGCAIIRICLYQVCFGRMYFLTS